MRDVVGHSDYDHWDKTYPPAYESIIFPAAAKQLLLAGVTSARDLGGPLAPSISARDRINAGKIPDDVRLGAVHSARAVPGTEAYRWGVNGPDDAQAKVRKLVDGKVDVIKLIDQDEMTMEEVRAVVAVHSHSTWRELDAWGDRFLRLSDDRDSRGDLLAVGGDDGRQGGRHRHTRQVR